ncbi:hypothetical protein RGQ30_21780 [Limnobacter thiooxidans]|uniref:Uncharacterized protein n=2 Tax=Limnobacter thiooxidans TaxID=131080 RepID=A0AA86JLA7_9BURK|nr:hypothetical protein RGQ30_21780 [Limnobacter thiooxidans]
MIAIETGLSSDRSTEIVGVNWNTEGLKVSVFSKQWNACVRFEWVHGFRVLDESDLTEFWQHCNLLNGWVFEVLSGGWRELENQRENFITGKSDKVKEFLIIGTNECISILSEQPPAISVN